MSKNNKRLKKEEMMLESFKPHFELMDKLGIEYDKKFCDGGHTYVVHTWIGDSIKCNLFMKTLKWVPFGFHKGISGVGLYDLQAFLLKNELPKREEELSYAEKIAKIKEVLLVIRNGTNFDIIDEVIEKYCN